MSNDWLSAVLDPSVELSFPFVRWSRLQPHWQLESRSIEEHLVYLVQSGRVRLDMDQSVLLKPGSIMWMPPHMSHALTSDRTDQAIELYHMRFTLAVPCSERPLIIDHKRWDLAEPYASLLSEYRFGLNPHPLRMRAKLYLLLEGILHPLQPTRGTFTIQQVDTLRGLIQQSDDVRLHVGDLADALRLNHDHFSRVFKRSFGASPRTWIARERVLRIADDLESIHESLADIAQRYGYPDVYAFSKQFSRFMGVSPGRYRDQFRDVDYSF